jgi:hypothetical protein
MDILQPCDNLHASLEIFAIDRAFQYQPTRDPELARSRPISEYCLHSLYTNTFEGPIAMDARSVKNGLGFLTIATGHGRYAKQAEVLLLSLKRNMPGVPVAVVTDNPRLAAVADHVVSPLTNLSAGVVQKAWLDHYTPFKETLFIDSDCIATRPFVEELQQIRQFDFSPAMERVTPKDGTDEYVANLAETLQMIGGDSYPKFNGGVYFFNTSARSAAVFRMAREFHENYRAYGIKTFDKSGPGEETIFALALAKLGLTDLYHDRGRLMRTPTGLKGALSIEPLGGGCSFERHDGKVSPAICHFAGPYIFLPEYRLAAYSLAQDVPMAEIRVWVRMETELACSLSRARKFFEYKIQGARRRLSN